MVLLRFILLAFALVAAWPVQAQDKLKGIALVIGQAKYEKLSPLTNPPNDARKIEALLASLGFATDLASDLTARKLRRTLDGFLEDAEGADVALVYYSGHGIEAGGENFLIPVDAGEGVEGLAPVGPFLDELRRKARITIVLLDACRNNPFPPGTKVPVGGELYEISANGLTVTRGFGVIEEGGESLGTVVGFAASPGRVAFDGKDGEASPYAAALLKHLAGQGFDFGDVMTMVTEEVYLTTDARQIPWVNASLRRLLYFGAAPEETASDDALIRGERRKLLLTIATVPDKTRSTVEKVAAETKVPLAGLYDMLRALGIENAPPELEDLNRLLTAQAEEIRKIMEERRALDPDDPEIARLLALADKALGEGALPAARTFLNRAKERVEETRDTIEGQEEKIKAKRLANAAVYARSAEAFLRAFDYLNAAADYGRAFDWVEKADANLAFTYKIAEASAYGDYGDIQGDYGAFERSIRAYEVALAIFPRQRDPVKWAAAKNDFGATLHTVGNRTADSDLLDAAITQFMDALEVRTRKALPDDWARTQHNLGVTYLSLAERRDKRAMVDRAIAAFKSALEVRKRSTHRLEWAGTQVALGGAYSQLTRFARIGAEMAAKSVQAFEAAITAISRETEPRYWAQAYNNLGAARRKLAGFTDFEGNIRLAIDAYEMALQETPRENYPLEWAATQTNLALSLSALGKEKADRAMLERAVALVEASLTEMTRERNELGWASMQQNYAVCLQILGELIEEPPPLTKAIAAYTLAMQVKTAQGFPLDWIDLSNSRGGAKLALGILKKSRETILSGREDVVAAWDLLKALGYTADEYYKARLKRFDKALRDLG